MLIHLVKTGLKMLSSSKYVLAVLLAFVVCLLSATPASSEETPGSSDSTEIIKVDDGSGIIPKPGSGTSPSSPTDRGGALQLGLLGLLILFPVVAIVSIRRQAKRNKVSDKT